MVNSDDAAIKEPVGTPAGAPESADGKRASAPGVAKYGIGALGGMKEIAAAAGAVLRLPFSKIVVASDAEAGFELDRAAREGDEEALEAAVRKIFDAKDGRLTVKGTFRYETVHLKARTNVRNADKRTFPVIAEVYVPIKTRTSEELDEFVTELIGYPPVSRKPRRDWKPYAAAREASKAYAEKEGWTSADCMEIVVKFLIGGNGGVLETLDAMWTLMKEPRAYVKAYDADRGQMAEANRALDEAVRSGDFERFRAAVERAVEAGAVAVNAKSDLPKDHGDEYAKVTKVGYSTTAEAPWSGTVSVSVKHAERLLEADRALTATFGYSLPERLNPPRNKVSRWRLDERATERAVARGWIEPPEEKPKRAEIQDGSVGTDGIPEATVGTDDETRQKTEKPRGPIGSVASAMRGLFGAKKEK